MWKRDSVLSGAQVRTAQRFPTGIRGMPAWPSLCECLRSAGDLPAILAWGFGPRRPGLGEGRGRLRMLDRPRPAQSAGKLGRAAQWGQRAGALLGETQPRLPPNTRWPYNLSSKPEHFWESNEELTEAVLWPQAMSVNHGFPGEIGYLVPLPWHELDFYINGRSPPTLRGSSVYKE